jgi:glycosyltransferase involved in cell wall biosynthesis
VTAVLEFLIPFYGEPRYLHQAIAGIRALVDTDWRLTIVEDAYPGGTAVERQVVALGDDRIRYLRNERNLGVNANVHRCIQLAERDHFVITGYDDEVRPNYGQVVAGLLARHPDAALIQPAVEVVDEDGRPHRPLPDRIKALAGPGRRHREDGAIVLRGESAVASLLRGNWLYTPALCYRRDALQRAPFRPGIDAAHDLGFVVDVLLDGGTLVVGTEVCFAYRRHRRSHSSSFARSGVRFEQERRYFDDIGAELRDRGWHIAARSARRRLLSRFNAATQLPQALRHPEPTTIRSLLRQSLR